MNAPMVSVILSVYNGEIYIGRAVESVLSQTFTDFEFIIVNDGSTDGTSCLLSELNDPRVVLVAQDNKGLIASLNTGCSMAKGKYLARQDADDVSLPERLEKQVAFMEAHPDVGLLGTAYRQVDEDGKELRSVTPPGDDRGLRKALIRYNPFCHGSVLERKSVFEDCGGYRLDLKHVEDYGLWFEFARRSRLANLPEVLYEWRYSGGNVSVMWEREQLQTSLKVRAEAIAAGDYSALNYFHLLRPYMASLMPAWARRLWRRYRYGHQPVTKI